MSICKGWGKFYAGLANGSVNVYNWKVRILSILNLIAKISLTLIHV